MNDGNETKEHVLLKVQSTEKTLQNRKKIYNFRFIMIFLKIPFIIANCNDDNNTKCVFFVLPI